MLLLVIFYILSKNNCKARLLLMTELGKRGKPVKFSPKFCLSFWKVCFLKKIHLYYLETKLTNTAVKFIVDEW